MQQAHRQSGFAVRFEWGQDGCEAIVPDADVGVVVDVLSFTTTLSVAVQAGIRVWPYRWGLDSAPAFAAERGAVLAVGRSQARRGQISLSPGTIRAASGVSRLVLPSPNGSTIAATLAETGIEVLASCLRNAPSVARYLNECERPRPVVAVIAAGERWDAGGLRPAVEDLWGAGALIAELQKHGWTGLSPEAQVAADAWHTAATRARELLLHCASGQELTDHGYREDVLIAAAVGTDTAVPRLQDGSFQPSS